MIPGHDFDQLAMAEKIIKDAEGIWRFFTTIKRIHPEDIIISGRSIGSGPAIHLAGKYETKALILISPIKSVKATAN